LIEHRALGFNIWADSDELTSLWELRRLLRAGVTGERLAKLKEPKSHLGR
jgi:hypothetical protein